MLNVAKSLATEGAGDRLLFFERFGTSAVARTVAAGGMERPTVPTAGTPLSLKIELPQFLFSKRFKIVTKQSSPGERGGETNAWHRQTEQKKSYSQLQKKNSGTLKKLHYN